MLNNLRKLNLSYLKWNKKDVIGGVYILNEEDIEAGFSGFYGDKGKKDSLKVGDKVLCTKHAGDCFYEYVLLRESEEGALSIVEDKRFGAYGMASEPIRVFKKEFVLK